MTYPRPDAPLLQHWQAAVSILQEKSQFDHSVLRVAYPTTLEITAASPGNDTSLAVGQREHRDGSGFCDQVLERRRPLRVVDASKEPQWDSCRERRSGHLAYCGAPLFWPDDEAFGTLAMLSARPVGDREGASDQRLLECLATGISSQLELIYRRQQQHYESTHDPLTGLANAVLFRELAEHQIQRHRRHGGELWMLIWSIDEYGEASDAHNGPFADAMLRAMAERARACIRQADTLARIDENCFALLLSDANEFVVSAVADRVRRNTRRIQLEDGRSGNMSLSFGASRFQDEDQINACLQRCEAAARVARDAGGDQLVSSD